ncbi:hypothetical protein TIFTF001_012722 [Ficus carica]|uniref:Uncharacterized protein n=1 Tax=Ficus carica TaxID=3494 RepID=A0AA88DI47_FICCA|nr:hypothetical protein TIFTF001_012722 [Ficus carica]
MAKTKSRRATKKPPKKQMKLDTVFKLTEYWIGKAICVVCKETYDTTITDLTEPTDM